MSRYKYGQLTMSTHYRSTNLQAMNGSLFFALGLFLAIIALTKGIPGGLGPQSPAGPGEQALVTKVSYLPYHTEVYKNCNMVHLIVLLYG